MTIFVIDDRKLSALNRNISKICRGYGHLVSLFDGPPLAHWLRSRLSLDRFRIVLYDFFRAQAQVIVFIRFL